MQRRRTGTRWVRDKAWLVGAAGRERIAGIMTDISAEKGAEEQQRLLSRELDHRLKNSFALVQSIVRLSARTAQGLGDVRRQPRGAHPGARARARTCWSGARATVADLEAIDPRDPGPACRAGRPRPDRAGRRCTSPRAPCRCSTWRSTSSRPTPTKYGALSVPGGRGQRALAHPGRRGRPALLLTWQESGGPPVAAARRAAASARC